MKKDTIYIDIEDDITSIIDKVKDSKSKVVALVPPKRSTALNSVVNLKLLKKAAEEAGKRPVLVTNETSLLGLAGGVSIYAAQNLHSKPYVPDGDMAPKTVNSIIDGSEVDPNTPVGELDEVHSATETAKEGKPPAKVKDKKRFKIPSFDRFRTRLFLIAGALILLGLGWWWAFFLAPKATVAINAQTSPVDITFEFTADTSVQEDDFEKNIFTAEAKSITDTVSQQFTPTGSKNVGDRASGQMTVQNCDTSDSFVLPQGTISTSPGGYKFEFLEEAAVPGADFDGGTCSSPGETTVNVRAVEPGADYNLASGITYDIDGVGSLITGEGSQMSGGTDDIVTVVAKSDVAEAEKALKDTSDADDISTMRAEFGEEFMPVNETFEIRVGNIASSPSVGQEADTGTVTGDSTQSMLAVNHSTIEQALNDFLNATIEGGDQIIYDNGINQVSFTLISGPKDGQAELRLTTTGHIGPELNTDQLAEEIKGMRYSETINYIESRPGVVEVEVNFEPFWVFTAPRADSIEFILNLDDGTS